MTRINTNVSSLVAQNRLASSNKDLNSALTRLSTGLRINSGSDDPAGLIASEALRSEVTSLGRSISNTKRASQIISTADSALSEVSNLLTDIRGLVVEASNSGALSDEEIAANQLQVDSSLEAINRIAQTTTFQGRKLLDGSLDFTSNAGSVSTLKDISIDQANLGTASKIDVAVDIKSAAEQAEVTLGADAFNAAAVDATAISQIATKTVDVSIGGETITISGNADFDAVEIIDGGNSSTASEGIVNNNGTLEITVHTAGTASTVADVVGLINGEEGFATLSATSATAATAGDAGTTNTTDGDNIGIKVVDSGNENIKVTYSVGTAADAVASQDADGNITVELGTTSSNNNLANIASKITAIGADVTATVTDADGEALTGVAELDDITIPTGSLPAEVSGEAIKANTLKDDLVFQLNGSSGAETFNFGKGTTISQITAAVNLVSDATGVKAEGTSSLSLSSSDYGSDALVSVDVISEGTDGQFESALSSIRATGKDIVATVNGVEAGGDGNSFSINTSSLDLSLTVEEGDETDFNFSITGGGATFQLGPDAVSTQRASIGIGSVSTGQLGGSAGRLYELGSGQSKSLTSNAAGAAEIVDQVIGKINSVRGRLGAFQSTTLESNLASLNETRANLQEAESSIRDADFAEESARLTRAQILVQSGTNVLSLANQSPQNVLSLIR